MKSIKIDLDSNINDLELYIFSDEHIGDANSDIQGLKNRIEYVRTHENCYAILNGDIIDNATKTSVSDIYSQTMNPQSQVDMAVELFEPIKDKILCSTLGNHEARTYKKEGIDPMAEICKRLGIHNRYSTTACLLFIRFGSNINHKSRKMCYTGYVTHGSGGGRKEGAKAIRLADLAAIVDFDFVVMGHTHLPLTMKIDSYRVCQSASTAYPITKLFVNSSANLNYGGYGETLGCKPACKDKPVIHLNGHKRDMKAIL